MRKKISTVFFATLMIATLLTSSAFANTQFDSETTTLYFNSIEEKNEYYSEQNIQLISPKSILPSPCPSPDGYHYYRFLGEVKVLTYDPYDSSKPKYVEIYNEYKCNYCGDTYFIFVQRFEL